MTSLALALLATRALAAAASPVSSPYTVTVGSTGPWADPDDTPAQSFIDKDGAYFFQSSHAEYGPEDERVWQFWSGRDMESYTFDRDVSEYVDPRNPLDTNKDVTWRCNNSPTGKREKHGYPFLEYTQKNYCDLMGVWVDPDTGYWYGLVHNEFTGRPFGDSLHFDRIDYAVSKDGGRTWDIRDGVITSPFPTVRDDNVTFPESTYKWGAGDQRLVVDIASGYFYVNYCSRVIDKGDLRWWVAHYSHYARAPISGKMAPGTWHKWYNGSWSEPGVGGLEGTIFPVTSNKDTGYPPPHKEYDPKTPGFAAEQVAKGLTPPTSPLQWMDVSWNAYLGLWVGQPTNPVKRSDKPGPAPQEFYGTDDLTSQKWWLLGDTGDYKTKSAYRWQLDAVSKTSQTYLGKRFRAYCSFGCSEGKDGEWVDVSIEGQGRKALVAAAGDATTGWAFRATGDGAYAIINAATSDALSLASDSPAQRAWGAKLVVRRPDASVNQQWFVIRNRRAEDNSPTGTVRLVNRYSGLVLALSDAHGAETTPHRSWADESGSDVGGGRTPAQQEVVLEEVEDVDGGGGGAGAGGQVVFTA
ncbi:hypothetical protein VHUM_00592 [Vanrija humicola]|uniref:Ricin B lectin domain-containing protein n=1 Tax=Vanrija humicola TaxID=5417 RepID=A0A7D8V617_VANHU|nr:hypothetical protein VHUM_00592 [Vanrija humicola]